MRVFSLRQSDGKSEFLDPTTPRGKFAKRRTRSSFAGRRETHAGMFFFGLREGSCWNKGGQWSRGYLTYGRYEDTREPVALEEVK
eukprot:4232951-Prymnesium_polylepis.1